jgi:hypothetical protein
MLNKWQSLQIWLYLQKAYLFGFMFLMAIWSLFPPMSRYHAVRVLVVVALCLVLFVLHFPKASWKKCKKLNPKLPGLWELALFEVMSEWLTKTTEEKLEAEEKLEQMKRRQLSEKDSCCYFEAFYKPLLKCEDEAAKSAKLFFSLWFLACLMKWERGSPALFLEIQKAAREKRPEKIRSSMALVQNFGKRK